jgi:hypothetical protein
MRVHDEDVAWQQREITGSTLVLCDQCGRPLDGEAFTLAETAPIAEPLDGQRICRDCWEKIGRGEAEADWDDDDEDPSVL